MSQPLPQYITASESILRLVLALVMGGLVGIERQAHGRSAGLRTNILVCLGASAVMIAFQRLFLIVDTSSVPFLRMDPARAAAGIITGIGFLGAGTIVKQKNVVVGLTTAATIWVVAAIGIIVGLGEYLLAVPLTALVLLTLFVLDRIKVRADLYKEVVIEGEGGKALFESVRERVERLGLVIKDYGFEMKPVDGIATLNLTVKFQEKNLGPALIEELSRLPGIRRISWG